MSRRRPCSVRRCWVHPILRKRLQRGEYHVLVQELHLDDHLFQQNFRMSNDVFDELLGKVGPLITKADTHMRLSIGPTERLAICLRSSDSGSLRNSAFGESLRDGSLQLPPDTVIPGAERLALLPHVFVGDEAFPLMDNLLRPFPGRYLTRERRMFNYRLSRAMLVVELAFGILSSQWRMFRRVITTSPEVTELCVKAACVLHNFLRRKTIGRQSRTPIAEYTDEATPTLCDAPRMGSNNASRRSIQLRETFCSYFNEEGAVPWQQNVV
ncbi:hypothetical protein F7725_013615 [Dissostichus mawsoni]|uniref:DDE Tnp4 domain-containing protein n=1 Tax=Dissostichus mawsoni TaxID=36200 RepID=A0A7J5Y4D5_DISMA|nr:hypothetical protein F7725_013615 [Dissostichus mawsoni]